MRNLFKELFFVQPKFNYCKLSAIFVFKFLESEGPQKCMFRLRVIKFLVLVTVNHTIPTTDWWHIVVFFDHQNSITTAGFFFLTGFFNQPLYRELFRRKSSLLVTRWNYWSLPCGHEKSKRLFSTFLCMKSTNDQSCWRIFGLNELCLFLSK